MADLFRNTGTRRALNHLQKPPISYLSSLQFPVEFFFALLQDTTVRAHAELLDIQILVNTNHADL
uniref:Uncharacterized protein n=1 Tax=Anguilla anguilla TaxID=7936 RepID=A0A0E9TUV7_ANGAN